ncbi:MAG: (Fe-S)-binding protein [Helicobacter sp.]|uniref:(Fe-S)-binding protein n=1 Tax=Helicobacter sp. TaxID=218 RepID=UPI0025C0DFDB|nr:(Fe-S)-binding protein [Helicobacter sp.]MCH5313584.1 (Fe-S)-binding protein [Helicobacter sp.]
MRVFFFSTCLGSAAYADTCINAIKLLQKAGCEVVFKKDQTCCAQPSYNSGYYEQSRKIALHNVELFAGVEPIIVPSGSCSAMMREDYLALFEGRSEFDTIKQFSKRVYDLGEYLHKIARVQYEDKGAPTRVTWHSNCHALRTSKVIDSAKALLRSLQNVELVELEREEECCGFGGTFSIKEPEISNAMVSQKIEDILSRDVEYVISADAGCLLNISTAMKKRNIALKSIHLYDFLAQRIGA